jgi:hypothetical protein
MSGGDGGVDDDDDEIRPHWCSVNTEYFSKS